MSSQRKLQMLLGKELLPSLDSVQNLYTDPNSMMISWLYSKEKCSTLIKCLILTQFNKEEQWSFQCFQWEKFTDVKSFAQGQTTNSWSTQNLNQIYDSRTHASSAFTAASKETKNPWERLRVTSFRRNSCTNSLENTQEKRWRTVWVLIK